MFSCRKASPGHGAADGSHGAEVGKLARRAGPARRLPPSVPVGLEIDLDFDEERDLDRDLHTELALAEEVTDHLGEDTEPAAGSSEELSELLHVISGRVANSFG